MVIVDSVERETKAGDGAYLELTLEVVGDQYKGRKLWDRLNLRNKNEKAVRIAERTLSSICAATGVARPQDSAELHGIPMTIKVGIEEFNGQPQNRVKSYSKAGAAKTTAKVETTTAKTPPWQRG